MTRIGSLFSGYEGLGMAVQQVIGGDIAWVSDIDPGACKILAHRYPEVPNIGDITAVDWATVEPVDVITGGSPCQDVSAAGKRAGMRAGTRSGLWASMCDAIDIIRPDLVVWENVRGVLSAGADSAVEPCPICVGDERDSHLRALGRVVGDLSELGYVGRWVGLRAADVGAPHGRFRVFVVAWPPADARSGRRVRGADLHRDGGTQTVGGETGGHVGDSPVAAADAQGNGWDEGWPEPAGQLRGSDVAVSGAPTATDASRFGLGEHPGAAPTEEAGQADRDHSASDRGSRAATEWGPYAPAIHRWERLTRPAPAPTEPGKTGQPRLSPAFVEWLMGLPAGHVTDVPGLSRNEQLKALGNGVVPAQCAAALRLLLPNAATAARRGGGRVTVYRSRMGRAALDDGPDEPRLVNCPDCAGTGVLPGRNNPAADRLCDHPSCVAGEVDENDLEMDQ